MMHSKKEKKFNSRCFRIKCITQVYLQMFCFPLPPTPHGAAKIAYKESTKNQNRLCKNIQAKVNLM